MFKNYAILLGMVVYAYNSSNWETEAGKLRVKGQPGLQSQTLSQKRKNCVL
jgi:hypothetical protein